MAPELTIEVLAEQTGVPARTIRFYRQSGLISAPVRVGRRAIYDAEQADRLRSIAELREQGLSLEAIGRILDNTDPSALDRLRALGEQARSLWDQDAAGVLTAAEIEATIGTAGDVDRESLLGALEFYDVIRSRPAPDPEAEATYEVPSLGTLELAGRLLAAGVAPDLAYAAWVAMRQWLRPLSSDLVRLFARHTRVRVAEGTGDDELGASLQALLPIALRGVQLVFTSEMEAAVLRLISGELDAGDPGPDEPPPGGQVPSTKL